MFQEELEYVNNPITIRHILSVVKNILIKKITGTDNSTGKFYQTFKEHIFSVLHKLLQSLWRENIHNQCSCETCINCMPKPNDVSMRKEITGQSYKSLTFKFLNKILGK